MKHVVRSWILLLLIPVCASAAGAPPPATQSRMFEWTFESTKAYTDPFNDVEVDVIFSKDGQSWKVPTFWRGGQQWTVRFAPPAPGEYSYRLQCTDPSNPDLNGRAGLVRITAYSGPNELLRQGMLRVSANKRYLEHADGTPFYWLGDTWWTGLSDRLSWEGFRKLTLDRKAKGFTVIQIVAGLVPLEGPSPSDPGFCNEGGCVWDSGFTQISPHYFDSADRRILHLLEAGLVPAIVGGWNFMLREMGVGKMQKHWRYIIARYGAYPVFWVVGGEVFDPPETIASRVPESRRIVRGWTEIARYVRATDPYAHPVTAHEYPPPFDFPLQDESLTDFDLLQSGHSGWSSMAVSVAQLNMHYARTSAKPVVQGEVGYENHHNRHFEDFQRTAFWLSMLNGAAGHTYGADATWGAQTGDKPLHRRTLSFRSWEEGMNLPGSYQVGLGAKLLRQYQWWRFEPHPEWISPRGTTLLEARKEIRGDELGPRPESRMDEETSSGEIDYPKGEWKARNGTFRRPYAAGIPGEVRFIYVPMSLNSPPTVLGLESRVRYRAYFWEPSLGIRFDLGAVERPAPGAEMFDDRFDKGQSSAWTDHGRDKAGQSQGMLSARGEVLTTLKGVSEMNVVAAVEVQSDAQAALVLRYQDADHYVAAVYSPKEQSLYLLDRWKGADGRPLGKTPVPMIGAKMRLSAEVRDGKGAVSVTDGDRTYSTPIVELSNTAAGSAGLLHRGDGAVQRFDNFELRRSPALVSDESLPRKLYDAQGGRRGDLVGGDRDLGFRNVIGWDSFGRDKHILLDAYQPPTLPTAGDWVLVLETRQ